MWTNHYVYQKKYPNWPVVVFLWTMSEPNLKIWILLDTMLKKDELLSGQNLKNPINTLKRHPAATNPHLVVIFHLLLFILGRVLMKPVLIAVTSHVKNPHIEVPEATCRGSHLMRIHRTICPNRIQKLQYNSILRFLWNRVCWFLVGNQRNQFSSGKI